MNYFKDSEFYCNCGCTERVTEKLKERVDYARLCAGTPFVITSAMRCKEYNNRVGASPTSSHTNGTAVDIKFTNSTEKYKIVKGLIMSNFRRIGINDNLGFIHADWDMDKPQDLLFAYGSKQ